MGRSFHFKRKILRKAINLRLISDTGLLSKKMVNKVEHTFSDNKKTSLTLKDLVLSTTLPTNKEMLSLRLLFTIQTLLMARLQVLRLSFTTMAVI